MEIIFADAFYFIALLNEADQYHRQAVLLSESIKAHLVTTDFVLVEVADAMAGNKKRGEMDHFFSYLRSQPFIDVIPADRALLDAGLRLYALRKDKAWSLTHCISFSIMHRRSITKVLTHDHHFEQAGFRKLL